MEMRPSPVTAHIILAFKDHGAQTVLVSVTRYAYSKLVLRPGV